MQIENYINGNDVSAVSGSVIANYNPAIGAAFGTIPDSDEIDVQHAVSSAKLAFDGWSCLKSDERAELLLDISRRIIQHIDQLAEAETIDNGKPLWLSRRVDIPRASANFRFYATALLHQATAAHQMQGDNIINYTLRQPLGVVGCISPWNLPLYLFTWKIAPALAAGNCVVAKPSEVTPLSAYLLGQICKEAGLPPGVLNIVHGLGGKVGSAIVSHNDVKAISFTGGTNTGAEIARIAAPMFKKLSLELGGKNPNIIFADCDYERMLKTTVQSSFANQGQICLCGSRIFVERPLYDRFKKDFVAQVNALIVGDPMDATSRLGAIVSESHLQKVLSYVSLARDEGGDVLTGGNRLTVEGRCRDGWFMRPTVIEGLAYDCRTNQEEIFGPVVTIMPFDSEDEVLMYANSVRYGLSATVWTSRLQRAHRMAAKLEAGIVWVNCWLLRDLRTPFGGMKDSGVGREGGFYALDFFTEPKNVCIDYSE